MPEDSVVEIIKQRGRHLVQLGSGESFYIPSALLRMHPLEAGQPLAVERYRAGLLVDEYKLALERAARMLSQRDYSSGGIYEKLSALGFQHESLTRAIAFLLKRGYLDDARFASQLLERKKKRSGSYLIRRDMRQMGLSEQEASQALQQLSEEEEQAHAAALLQKYLRNKTWEPRERYQKALAFLGRRGFGYDIAKAAVQQQLQSEDDFPSDG